MATEPDLLVLVEARVDSLEKQLRKANDAARRNFRDIEGHSSNARKRIEGETRAAAENANKALASIGAKGFDFATGFATGALAAGLATVTTAAKESITAVAELKREAERAGVGTGAFQELSFAARQSGVSIDALTDGLKEMNLRADEFVLTGKGSGAEAFQRLGYGADELKRKLKDPAALFVEIIGRLQQLDEAARIRVADEIFGGTGGEQFVRFVEQGAAGVTKLREEARATGVVISDDVVAKAVELDKKFNKLADIVSGRFKGAVVEVASVLEDWITNLDVFLSKLEKGLNNLGNSSFFAKLNDWFSNDLEGEYYGAKRLTPEDQKRAAADKFFTPALDALSRLKLAANAAAGQLGDIKLPPQGLPVPSAAQPSPFAGGDAVSQFVRRVIAAESGGKADAKNPNSSATGVGQFVKETWLRLFREVYPAEARTMGESAILELRKDADVSKKMIETYAAENATALRNAGLAVTEANLHLAHFLGAGGAVKALKADPRASARAVLGDDAANANPTIIGGGRTIADVLAYADRRANSTRLAAGDRTDAEKSAERQADAVKKVIDALGLEAAEIGKTKNEQELLQALQRAGVDLSSKEGQEIRARVLDLQKLRAAQAQVDRSAEQAKKARESIADMGAQATTGILQDLRSGATAAEAFSNALGRIADQLIEMAVKQLFANAFAAPTGGGGGGGFGFFSVLGSLFGFSEGGWTGPGSKYQPAGIVHADEFVFSKEATRRIGVDNLEAMHRSAKGYADGGRVGIPSFVPATVRSPENVGGGSAQAITINAPVTVNATGGTPEQNNDLAKRMSKQLEATMRGVVCDELMRQRRPGNMLDGRAGRR